MKKWEKEIVQKQITDEQKVIYRLRDSYKIAIQDVKDKISVLQSREQTQSVIYQLKYQQELQKQLENIYSKMSQKWYSDIDTYLKDCYEDGFFGTMYELHQEGIPIVIPFNQAEMAQAAAQSDYEGIKLSEKLYTDSVEMARISRQEITRGIATNESWANIARRVEKRGEAGLYQATRIVRTESHRIHNEVKMKTIQKVQEEGADVVKQWDSTVDKRTRPHHVELDGQLREIDQPFKIPSTGATAMYPGGFGKPAEDIHCRCIMLQRARWALDKSEIDKTVGDLRGATDAQLQAWADKLGVSKDELIKASNGIIEADGTINHSIKAKNYNDFKKKYGKKAETEVAKYQAQLDVVKQEKESFLKNWSAHDEADMETQVETWKKVFGEDDPDVKKWESFKKKQSDLEKKLGKATKTPATSKKKADVKVQQETPKEKIAKLKAQQDAILNGKSFDTQDIDVQLKWMELEDEINDLESSIPTTGWEDLKKNAVRFDNGRDADKYHKEKNFVQSRWDNDLTANERDGIHTYTTNFYGQMNSVLRSDSYATQNRLSRVKKAIDNCTAGLEKTLLAEDTVVFRGMGGADALSAWTGIPMNQLSNKAVQDSLIGSRLTEKAFMSTGTNMGSAWSGIKLEVYLPKGSQAMYVDPISAFSGEYEILVQRNSTFEVKEIKTDSRGYIESLVLLLVEQTH